MKKKKLRMCILVIGIIICGVVFGNCYMNKIKKNEGEIKEEYTVKRMHATYSYNVNDICKLVSDADYIFVAKVDSIVNTVYKNPVKIEDTWISRPYTRYKLSICKNIKGNLSTKKKVTVLKSGGKGKNTNIKFIYDNDNLPTKGKYYIFMAYVQKDGSLLVSGANSTLPSGANYNSTINYKKVVSACRKMGSMGRTRYRINSNKVYR